MTQPKQYLVAKDINGKTGECNYLSVNMYSVVLTTGGGAKSITIPASTSTGVLNTISINKFLVEIRVGFGTTEINGDVWMAVNDTAVLPTTSSFASTTSVLLSQQFPSAYVFNAGDVLSFISNADDLSVSLALYTIQG